MSSVSEVERIPYDEFALFHENAEEFGLPYGGPPEVRREAVEVEPGRHVSALVWGHDEPELVLLHGGAQNAHTWDTVAMALGRPLVAIDLPGHGHSGPPPAGAEAVGQHATDVAGAIEALAPQAAAVVGMSLGGLTALALSQRRPDLVRRMVLVDVTPGVDEGKAGHIVAFVNGPESFDSFDEILARTIEFNPTRLGVLPPARHPAQRAPAGGRDLGLALCAVPGGGRHDAPGLWRPVGCRVGLPRTRSCSCAAPRRDRS